MKKIHILHENQEWLIPLREALGEQGLPYREWLLDEGTVPFHETPPEGVFYNRSVMFKQRTTRSALLDQHRAINDALQARDPSAARAAIEAHLDYVEIALRAERKADAHEEIARQRMERLSTRA